MEKNLLCKRVKKFTLFKLYIRCNKGVKLIHYDEIYYLQHNCFAKKHEDSICMLTSSNPASSSSKSELRLE